MFNLCKVVEYYILSLMFLIHEFIALLAIFILKPKLGQNKVFMT